VNDITVVCQDNRLLCSEKGAVLQVRMCGMDRRSAKYLTSSSKGMEGIFLQQLRAQNADAEPMM